MKVETFQDGGSKVPLDGKNAGIVRIRVPIKINLIWGT